MRNRIERSGIEDALHIRGGSRVGCVPVGASSPANGRRRIRFCFSYRTMVFASTGHLPHLFKEYDRRLVAFPIWDEHYGKNGLSRMAGGRLEKILEKLTTKRIFAVLLGAGVTAIIQSSSATTVMVVGFVNSGIMKLSQAVGVIMGANIGTTITSWMLSLTGIEGSTVWLQLLKPSSASRRGISHVCSPRRSA